MPRLDRDVELWDRRAFAKDLKHFSAVAMLNDGARCNCGNVDWLGYTPAPMAKRPYPVQMVD